MNNKIKKFFIAILYIFVWILFVGSLFVIFVAISEYQEINKWGLLSSFLLIPILSGYLLRSHFKFLRRKLREIYPKIIIGMKKINNISLPTTIIIASIILGGFYYVSQVNKQRSIERQQQIKIEQEKQEAKAEAEQEQKEYVAKRKMECYEIFKSEKERVSNVENYGYIEDGEVCSERGRIRGCETDTCEIIYKNTETGKYFRKYR